MDYKLLNNAKAIGEAFVARFVMTWEEFQVEQKDFIAEMEKKNHLVDFTFYEQSLFWDRMPRNFPCVSMAEALKFLRKHRGPVFFMGEKGEDGSWRGKRVVDFIAEADAHALAEKMTPMRFFQMIYMFLMLQWNGVLYLLTKLPIGNLNLMTR